MTQERIGKLNDLGFVWEPTKQQSPGDPNDYDE
jgi:hypothetical protein